MLLCYFSSQRVVCGDGVGRDTTTQAVQKLECWLRGKCSPDYSDLPAGGRAPTRGARATDWGREKEIERAGGWGGGTCGGHTETVRARESERARDFESIIIVRPSGYLCAATLASTTPTFRTQDLTESISAPSDFSFRAGPLPKVS